MEMFVPYILLVALIGFWASKWNRSVIIWCVIGLLISPLVAAILLLIFGNNRPKCPSCRAHIDPEATRCRHCGDSV